jgi:hypothetical protein
MDFIAGVTLKDVMVERGKVPDRRGRRNHSSDLPGSRGRHTRKELSIVT